MTCALQGGGLAWACNSDKFWEEYVELLENDADGISCWAEEVSDWWE